MNIFFITIVRQMMLSRSISKPHLQPPLQRRGGLEPLTSRSYKGIEIF